MNNLFLVEEDNLLYKKALARELAVWSSQPKCIGGSRCTCGNCNNNDLNFSLLSEDNPLLRQERNKVIGKAGINDWEWVNYLVEKFGTFDLGLSLGSGRGSTEKAIIERSLVKNLHTIDLSETSITNKHLVGDLNFMHLPEDKYDLIITKGSIHHILNLEHLLIQVNKSLKKNGIFIVREYIGESKWQWSNDKIKFVNGNMFEKFGNKFEKIKLEKPNYMFWNEIPFESIRSEEITSLLSHFFGDSMIFEKVWSPVSYSVLNNLSNMNSIPSVISNELIEQILRYSIELDYKVKNLERIRPCYLFGAYRKSKLEKTIKIKKWNEKDINKNFRLNTPYSKRFRRFVKKLTN